MNSLEKLRTFTKEEIIEALSQLRVAQKEYVLTCLVNTAKNNRLHYAISEHEKALTRLQEARDNYFSWRTEMCEKYGDGRTVSLSSIPSADFARGLRLEKLLSTAEHTEQALDEKLCKLLEVQL